MTASKCRSISNGELAGSAPPAPASTARETCSSGITPRGSGRIPADLAVVDGHRETSRWCTPIPAATKRSSATSTPRHYSARSAIAGSTRMARLAGARQPRRPAASRIAGATTNVVVSRASTPNSSVSRNRVSNSAAPTPMPMPRTDEPQSLAEAPARADWMAVRRAPDAAPSRECARPPSTRRPRTGRRPRA